MDGEGVGLHEGPDVHQDVEPLASGQLPLVVLSLGSVASFGLERGPAALVERVAPIGELADGMSPLSRRAMQIARVVPPVTGPYAPTAHRISRSEKCWILSPSRRVSWQG